MAFMTPELGTNFRNIEMITVVPRYKWYRELYIDLQR